MFLINFCFCFVFYRHSDIMYRLCHSYLHLTLLTMYADSIMGLQQVTCIYGSTLGFNFSLFWYYVFFYSQIYLTRVTEYDNGLTQFVYFVLVFESDYQ